MPERDAIILELLPFARSVAGRILRRRNGTVDYLEDDLKSAAALATVRSVDKYLAGNVQRSNLKGYLPFAVANEVENTLRLEQTMQTRYQDHAPARGEMPDDVAASTRSIGPGIADAVPDVPDQRIIEDLLSRKRVGEIAASVGLSKKALWNRRLAIGEALFAAGVITGKPVRPINATRRNGSTTAA